LKVWSCSFGLAKRTHPHPNPPLEGEENIG
jgi:hypothetical protein